MPENNASSQSRNYALLPDEVVLDILNKAPETAKKVAKLLDADDDTILSGMEKLRQDGMIRTVLSDDFSPSLIAVDGSYIVEKMAGLDLLLAMAVGVEGLHESPEVEWGAEGNQYYSWQDAIPHEVASSTLCQGIMFLMELSVLANDKHEVRIMDGTHFTSVIKINAMLQAREESASRVYIETLRSFLRTQYDKIIPDIPDIISKAFNSSNIIALAKYSSSRDIIDSRLAEFDIILDDKTFFTFTLGENEYTEPLSVGQSESEREKIWNDLHIHSNLGIPEDPDLNRSFKQALDPLKTRALDGTHKASELYFTFYKPYADGPCYKIEIKKEVALDRGRCEIYLNSLKRQIVFPEIREPYPQFLVDLMAKSIASGMFAMQEAIRLDKDLSADGSKFNVIFNKYRT